MQQLKSLFELAHLKSAADVVQRKPLLGQTQLEPAVGAVPVKLPLELAWLKSVVGAAQLKYGLSRKERTEAAVVL